LTDLPEPTLDDEARRQFARGIEELNTGYYFECHETLEDVWHGVRGPARDFFQGLIQLAVAFYHLTRGNDEGARRLLDRGLARLSKYPAHYGGVDLQDFREQARVLRAKLGEEGLPEVDPAALPRCRPL
jgi:predicted metal-dependent hydrolase